jgi:Flp pilus assembly protein TadD
MPLSDQIYSVLHKCIKCGQKDAGVWILNKLLDEYPEHVLAHHARGVIAHDDGDLEKARLHFEKAAELSANNIEIQKNLAHFYHVSMGDLERSLNQYVKVILLNGEDTDSLMIAGHISVFLHRFEDAKKYYSKLLDLEPWHTDLHEMLNKLNSKQSSETASGSIGDFYAMGITKVQNGDINEAIKYMEKAVAMDPQHALAHNDLGVLYYQAGNKEKAVFHYEEAARLDPSKAVFMKNLGDFYYVEKENYQGAMEKYLKALKIDAEDTETLQSISRVCMAVGKDEDARYFLNRILEIDPENHDALRDFEKTNREKSDKKTMMDLHLLKQENHSKVDLDDKAEAISELERKIQIETQNATAINNLGVLHYQRGNKENALECYERAVDLDPSQNIFLKNLADFYLMEQGRIEDAMKLYVKVLENDAEDIDSLIATGLVCTKLNNFADAKLFYQRSLEIDPYNVNAKQALDQLDRYINELNDSSEGLHSDTHSIKQAIEL